MNRRVLPQLHGVSHAKPASSAASTKIKNPRMRGEKISPPCRVHPLFGGTAIPLLGNGEPFLEGTCSHEHLCYARAFIYPRHSPRPP